jgi:hypothetical protein
MSAATLDAERPFGAITAQWRGPESPKAFFRGLRSAPSYFHEMIARGLHEAGFQVRYVRKRANHQVWNLYLLRGSVPPGTEAEAARQVMSVTLRRCGVECLKKEIEIAVIGNSLGATFLFQDGAPGTLAFTKGQESWCADAWP